MHSPKSNETSTLANSSPEPFQPSIDFLNNEDSHHKKLYECTVPDCGKKFRFKSEMDRHQTAHSNVRPYTCFYGSCRKSFKRPDALRNHLSAHYKITRFFCTEEGCDCRFVNRAALKYHMLKHENNKIYKCSYKGCDKAFVSLTQLKQHEKAVKYHRYVREFGFSLIDGEGLDNMDGSSSMADTNNTDYESLDDLSRMGSVKDNLSIYRQDSQDSNFDAFSYLESIYGEKKVRIDERRKIRYIANVPRMVPYTAYNMELTQSELLGALRFMEEENRDLPGGRLNVKEEPVYGMCGAYYSEYTRGKRDMNGIDYFLNF